MVESFGKRASSARAKFDAFVDEGRGEARRPDLSGAAEPTQAAEVRKQMGDGYRVSDGIFGDDEFVARVLADRKAVDAALSTRGTEFRHGAAGRPDLRRLWETVLQALDLDPVQVEIRPKARSHVHAKKVLIWLWVREFEGKQIEVARLLGVSTAAVSSLYGDVVGHASDFEEQGSAIVALSARGARQKKEKVSSRAPNRGKRAQRVRYHVTVDEG